MTTNSSQTTSKIASTYDPNIWEWTAPSTSQQGWECPRCGKIWAPWVMQCNCSKETWTVSWNNPSSSGAPVKKYKYEITSCTDGKHYDGTTYTYMEKK